MSEEMLSIDSIQKKYATDSVHLLLPNAYLEQITPFFKLSVVKVEVDLSPNSGDVYKIGSAPKKDDKGNDVKQGNKTVFETLYSPAKPLLMKIATAAGIQFDPDHTGIIIESRYMYKGKARGAIRLPDGSFRTQVDEKVIDLSAEEDRQRILLMDKAFAGLTGTEAWNASKMFGGSWVKKTIENEEKNIFMVSEEDRKKYIERQLLINIFQARKDAPQKALTGALLRVVRALTGLKGQYSEGELRRPFILARVNFSPDYDDPAVKSALLEQGIASNFNVFGGRAIPSSRFIEEEPVAADFESANQPDHSIDDSPSSDPAPIAPTAPKEPPAPAPDIPPAQEKKAPSSQRSTANSNRTDTPKSEPPKKKTAPAALPQGENANANTCVKCGKTNLSDSVVRYSREHFGMVLCFNCGKNEEKRRAKGNVA